MHRTCDTHLHPAAARVVLLGALLGLLLVTPVWAFSGSLSSTSGGIVATGNWNASGPTTISWSVVESSQGWWNYSYEFSHSRGQTSHFILEVSPTFTVLDLFNAHGDFAGYSVGTFQPGNSNPNMPGPIRGIKFCPAWGNETHISFASFRGPVWGDFYAKNGTAGGHGQNSAWNAGFLDLDPNEAAANGSIRHHLLVPDSYGTPIPVPEPGSVLLLGLGLVGWAAMRRRHHR